MCVVYGAVKWKTVKETIINYTFIVIWCTNEKGSTQYIVAGLLLFLFYCLTH